MITPITPNNSKRTFLVGTWNYLNHQLILKLGWTQAMKSEECYVITSYMGWSNPLIKALRPRWMFTGEFLLVNLYMVNHLQAVLNIF